MPQDFLFFAVIVLVGGIGFYLILSQPDASPVGLQLVELVNPQGVVVMSKTCELQEACMINKFSEVLFGACGIGWTFRIKAAEAINIIPIRPSQYWSAILARTGRVFSACDGVNTISDGTTLHVCGDENLLLNITVPWRQIDEKALLVIESGEWRCTKGVLELYET